MQLLNKQRYKIIIADESEMISRGMTGLYIPVIPNSDDEEGLLTDKDLEDPTNYVKYYLEKEWSDDSENSDTESEDDDEDDDYDWFSPPSPIPIMLDDFEDDPIDEDELEELIAVLDNIVQTNPNILDDPRPVIDLDLYKYASYVTGSDELVWEFEYCIHEDPTNTHAAD